MTDVNNDPTSDSSDSGGQGSSTDSGQDFVPPKDGSWIPRERATEMAQNAVNTATATVGREVAELRGRLDAQTEAQNRASAPAQLTAAQLRAQVDAGQISETEAQDMILDSRLTQMETRIVDRVATQSAEQQRHNLVAGQIEAYKAKVPNIMAEGSQERTRVVTEYNFLVSSLGMPATKQTELQAIRTVLGPVESIGTKADGTPEHHQETSGSGGGDTSQDGNQAVDGAPAHLSPDEKRYYADQIQKGIYSDWKAVSAELKFADANVRKRYGARV